MTNELFAAWTKGRLTSRVDAAEMSANPLYAYGELIAMGFSVYAPELLNFQQQQTLGDAYAVIDQLSLFILATREPAEWWIFGRVRLYR